MDELDKLGDDVRERLGGPSPAWLRAEKQRVLRAAQQPRREPRRSIWLSAAAVALLGVGLALSSMNFGEPSERTTTVALSAGAAATRSRLADGSSVALSPGTRALVESALASTRFDLQRGHVEFDVAHQGSRRFVVLAGAVEVTVVGTRFSVLHDASGAVEVHVTQGVVSVRSPERSAPIVLKTGDHFRGRASATAAVTTPALTAAPASTSPATAAAAQPNAAMIAPNPSSVTPSPDWEAAYRERRYAVAAARAREHGADGLLASLSAPKLAQLGDAARLGGDADLALRALDALKRRFPSSAQAANADFLGGKLLAARGQTGPAIARFEQYLKGGERAYTVEAMGRLVELYSASGDSARARATAERYLARAPQGPYRRLCELTLEKHNTATRLQ